MKQICLSIALFLTACTADASENVYAGLKYGIWNYPNKVDSQQAGNYSAPAMGVFGGVLLNKNLAVEVDYFKITKATSGTRTSKSKSLTLSLRPTFQISDNWDVFAKASWEYYRYNKQPLT